MSKPLPATGPADDMGLESAHRRAAPRLRLSAPAVFMGHGGRQKVVLLDISQTGAKLAFKEPPEGQAGFISWLKFETFGELVWREGLYAGFVFDENIPLNWLVTTRHLSENIDVAERASVMQAARAWVGG